MTVAAMATPFVALRRALRSLLPRRSALAAGAGIPPRLAGLATILEKSMRLALPGGNSAGSASSPAAASGSQVLADRRRRAAAKEGRVAGAPVNLTTARPRCGLGRSWRAARAPAAPSWCGRVGGARRLAAPAPPGRPAPRRRPWAFRPARAGAAGCPPSRSLPGRRWCLFRHRLPLTPPGAWVTRRPARMARQAVEPPAGRLNPRVELPTCAPGAPPGPVVAGGLRLSASGAGRAPCRASPPRPS